MKLPHDPINVTSSVSGTAGINRLQAFLKKRTFIYKIYMVIFYIKTNNLMLSVFSKFDDKFSKKRIENRLLFISPYLLSSYM